MKLHVNGQELAIDSPCNVQQLLIYRQLAQAVFRLGDDLKLAQDNIPVFGEYLRNYRVGPTTAFNAPEIWGAVLALVVMLALAAVVIRRRVKPE